MPCKPLISTDYFRRSEAAIRRPGHPRPRAWLTTVAYRYALTSRLKQRREIQAATVLALLGDDAIHHGRPADPQLAVEVLELLEAIARLPERQRQAVALAASGYTRAEIAARLGVSTDMVKHAIGEGRNTLSCHFRR